MSANSPSFHLSLAIKERDTTIHFYCELLGGKLEKTSDRAFNINLGGHQLTFHIAPDKVLIGEPFHWGLNVDWDTFHRIYDNLKRNEIEFKLMPDYQYTGTNDERVKMLFLDPTGYVLEYKAYKNSVDQF